MKDDFHPDGPDIDEETEEELEASLKEHSNAVNCIGAYLQKATVDNPFDYLIVFKDGDRVRFQWATWNPGNDWVLIGGNDDFCDDPNSFTNWCQRTSGYTCPRGIQIRLDDIWYVADAPEGS